MVDYVEFPNLGEFIKQNRDSLSYQTKIYFGYIIAQGLRYLQEYQIAHLDLKPANIMLHKKLMIKFIDFGESYHPDIKSIFYPIQTMSPAFLCLTLPLKITTNQRVIPTRTTFSL